MNPGSIPCPNCGAAWDEPCADWCAPALTEGHQHLAEPLADGPRDRVVRPSVSAVPDGLGFE